MTGQQPGIATAYTASQLFVYHQAVRVRAAPPARPRGGHPTLLPGPSVACTCGAAVDSALGLSPDSTPLLLPPSPRNTIQAAQDYRVKTLTPWFVSYATSNGKTLDAKAFSDAFVALHNKQLGATLSLLQPVANLDGAAGAAGASRRGVGGGAGPLRRWKGGGGRTEHEGVWSGRATGACAQTSTRPWTRPPRRPPPPPPRTPRTSPYSVRRHP
jgi:hypothetical protein